MAGAQPGSRKTPGSTSRRTANVKVVSSRRDFARSYAADWPPPVPATEEAKAIEDLKEEWAARSDDETVYDGYQNPRPMLMVDLHDFEIYRSPNTAKEARRHELISLHFKNVPTPKRLCFDGFLCLGGTRLYVKGVAIQDSSIEGYGNDQHPGVVAYLQSEVASKDQTHDVWYRLKKPSQAYAKFHEPYLSIAQLGKHALDFLEQRPPNSVELESFRIEFHAWLIQRFALPNTTLAKWHGELQNRIDFRVDINAYIDFFYSEACNLPNSEVLLDHPLWADCMVRGLTRVKKQDKIEELTVTTPEVYDMFKDTYFGKKLRSMPLAKSEKDQQARRKLELGFATTDPATGIAPTDPQYHPYGHLDIQIGDVVAFDPEEHDKTTWRNAEWEWLAYVQGVQPMETGGQRLFVLFLYRPRETNIFNAKYRFDSELFFSDNCNCGDGELLSTDIKGKYSIDWLPKKIDSSKGFFVRQTYLTENSAFVTFKDAHKICSCRKTAPINTYNCGETVYITKTVHGKPILEPVVVRHTNQTTGSVTVRKLLRLGRDCAQLAVEAKRTHIADNELVLTDEYLTVSAARIKRRCKIRFISKKDVLQGEIPLPYNRGGACDYFFVSMGISTFHGVSCLMYLSRLPERFNQDEGMGATVGVKKLRGLSMFSGGGNFDRGLEEGGAVEFRNAIDLDAHAIHTQRANAKDPSRLSLYYGSVDDYMRLALSGVEHTLVARIGDVQFIAAGTPCPGFSSLQRNCLSDKSLENASHLTTFASAVEHYLPEYAMLENVVSMTNKRKGLEDQNVLSQLVACLVGMGYQVNQSIMDSWSYGSGQHRSRIILTIAAPGLEPLAKPPHTHSRPSGDTLGRSLGELPNGQRFGHREEYSTPFTHLSAAAVTSDLPNIGNGNILSCISHPDHRISCPPGPEERALLRCIPRFPPGCGYAEAHSSGLIPLSLLKPGREIGKAYRRIKASGLIPTITTGLSIQDSRNGAVVHWAQDRSITILDARRAQGYLDEEPIIGDLTALYRIVGNGVDRKVAFALGHALLKSVMKNIQNNGITKVDDLAGEMEEMTVDEEEEMAIDAEEDTRIIDEAASDASTIHVHMPLQEDEAKIPDLDGVSDARIPSSPSKTLLSPSEQPTERPDNALRARSTDSSGFKRIRMEESTEPAKRTKVLDSTQSSALLTEQENSAKMKTRHTRHSGLEIEFAPKQWNRKPEKEYSANI